MSSEDSILYQKWNLVNDVLNTARRLYGIEEVPKARNPYKNRVKRRVEYEKDK